MEINGVVFNCELHDILSELHKQLQANNIDLLNKMKDSGHDIMVQCPYHGNGKEKRPSAGIRKLDGQFHCFACNEVHSLPEVISYCFGKNDVGVFGWNWLLKNFLTVDIIERKDIKLDFSRNAVDEVKNQYVSERELAQYRYYHPYMYKRKLTDEIIDLFDVGYDKATQCITFPVRDENGNCLFVARRSVNVKFFNYPPFAKKSLYGLYELKCLDKFPDEVIVCESMLDALTCWVYGKYAVAMNGLGDAHLYQQLSELPCRKLILATDNDAAGCTARKRIRIAVKNKIITEYILPDGRKDINELSKEEFDALQEVF